MYCCVSTTIHDNNVTSLSLGFTGCSEEVQKPQLTVLMDTDSWWQLWPLKGFIDKRK